MLDVVPDLKEVLGDPEKYDLINIVFSHCLFYLEKEKSEFKELENNGLNYVKAKGKKSREVAYDLITSLCKDSNKNFDYLLN